MTKKILLLSFLGLAMGFGGQAQESISQPALAKELARMAHWDQIAAYIPQGPYKEWSKKKWRTFKDSVFTTHHQRCDEIFVQYGYPGFDQVGKEGENNFWLMVQHSDHAPDFQQKILTAMKEEVDKKNANGRHFGLLQDRVNLNTGKSQVYGTQVTYNMKICQAYPKNLADSATVNQRRATVGLEPLEVYLNDMSSMHFEMNREYYEKKGVTEPTLYKIPSAKD
ncbi:MAG: DUF6624 domain-containing protein [Bacteroidota bacterium]